MKTFTLVLFVFANTSSAEDFQAPGGVWWKKKTVLSVGVSSKNKPQSLHLNSPTILKADEVVLKTEIYTEGHPLEIETRRLVFLPGAKILGFSKIPAEVPIPNDHPTPAATGKPGGGKGADGAPGYEGFPGRNGQGVDGPLPGEINIFAGEIVGTPFIEGKGQNGGPGGVGGRGQKGGDGGIGTPAQARQPGRNTRAGQGGPGGAPGKGGKGGPGGQGGLQIPVCFLTSSEFDFAKKAKVCSAPGLGGEAGKPGAYGLPGDGGPGGAGDFKRYIYFITATEGPGPKGPPGDAFSPDTPTDKCTLGVGEKGADGPRPLAEFWLKQLKRETPLLTENFPDFERARYEVTASWYEFHWWRLFELITRSSLNLLPEENQEKLDDTVRSLLEGSVDSEKLQSISTAWEKRFLDPLENHYRVIKESGFSTTRIEKILEMARPITSVLKKAKARGIFNRQEVEELQAIAKQVSKIRSDSLSLSIDSCLKYSKKVLASEKYRSLLLSRQTYFEVPVCQNPRLFLSEKEVQGKIELSHGYGLEKEYPPGVSAEEQEPETKKEKSELFFNFFEPVYDFLLAPVRAEGSDVILIQISPRKLNLMQVREFLPKPSHSTSVGTLGTHKGYVMPKEKITVENLSEYLSDLILIL